MKTEELQISITEPENFCEGCLEEIVGKREIDVVNNCLSLLNRELLQPYTAEDGKQYVGKTDKGACPFVKSLGTDYYCDNHQIIKMYLNKD